MFPFIETLRNFFKI